MHLKDVTSIVDVNTPDDVIYLDFGETFDTFSLERLIEKQKSMKING